MPSGSQFLRDGQPQNQKHHKNRHEDVEQDLRNLGGTGCHVGEAEKGGDHGNQEEDYGPSQHNGLLCAAAAVSCVGGHFWTVRHHLHLFRQLNSTYQPSTNLPIDKNETDLSKMSKEDVCESGARLKIGRGVPTAL